MSCSNVDGVSSLFFRPRMSVISYSVRHAIGVNEDRRCVGEGARSLLLT